MSWLSIFPSLKDEQVDEYQEKASIAEIEQLNDIFGVEKIINRKSGKYLISTSLFWKPRSGDSSNFGNVTIDSLKTSIIKEFNHEVTAWQHYIVPLLEGMENIKNLEDVVVRVYLAKDLEFLISVLTESGCEVYLMNSSSIRHNPGAMWRFLAMEESNRWVIVSDSDRINQAVTDLDRMMRLQESGLDMWRIPNTFHASKLNNPGQYRPIIARQFGVRGGIEVRVLLNAFVWHTLRGTMPNYCKVGCFSYRVFGSDWPNYGFDEWFLLAAIFPRYVSGGVLTLYSPDEDKNTFLFAVDIEYVCCASSRSEIVLVLKNWNGRGASFCE